jgi:c-di-AMP phosphodiesterase-like protein
MFKSNIAISTIPVNARICSGCSSSADELLNIKGVNASFVLSCIEGDIFISGRSLGDINVQVVLEKLGGGGQSHRGGPAHSFRGYYGKGHELMKKDIEEYLKEGER